MWGEGWGTMIWMGFVPVPTLGPLGWTLLVGALVASAAYARGKRRALAPTLLVAISLSVTVTALAGEVAPLVTFTNGTVADADEVNDNFDAVKTAVDDNDGRVTGLEGQVTGLEADKQERVSGTCPAGQSIRVVNANGTVTCEIDSDTDTNAKTLCGNGAFLNGDGSCDAGFLDADGVDAYNSAFDSEAEIDAAVADNGYSTGTHTTDTNAATLCTNGAFLNGDGTCDTADASGTCTAGRVCTGGHTHPGGQITSGTIDIGSGNYTHSTKTGYLHINGVDLIPGLNGYTYTTSAFGYTRPSGSSTSFFGHAPLDLPQGATITNVRIYTYDNSTDAVSQTWYCGVRYRPLTSTSGLVALERNLSINWAASASIRTSSTGGGTHVVDKVNNAYWLRGGVSNTDSSSNFRYYGCRVTYTYSDTNR
jgi:hypothetical protein